MPPLKYSFSHLSASFCKAKTCQSLQVTDAKKNKEARTPPINILYTHYSASFYKVKTCHSLKGMDAFQ